MNVQPIAISPSCDGIKDIKNTFKITTINVAGINNNLKQEQIMNFMIINKIQILGLSETKLKDSVSENIYKNNQDVTAWWSNDDENHFSTGVAIIMKKDIAKYVVKVNRYKGRIIHVIMLIKGKIRLSIIQIYNQAHNNDKEMKQ